MIEHILAHPFLVGLFVMELAVLTSKHGNWIDQLIGIVLLYYIFN